MEGDVHVQLGLKMGQLEAVDEAPLADLSDMVLLPRFALVNILPDVARVVTEADRVTLLLLMLLTTEPEWHQRCIHSLVHSTQGGIGLIHMP